MDEELLIRLFYQVWNNPRSRFGYTKCYEIDPLHSQVQAYLKEYGYRELRIVLNNVEDCLKQVNESPEALNLWRSIVSI